MTVADCLLAAILEDPADDAPRAAYADLLMDNGEQRGEFIARQLELARLPERLALTSSNCIIGGFVCHGGGGRFYADGRPVDIKVGDRFDLDLGAKGGIRYPNVYKQHWCGLIATRVEASIVRSSTLIRFKIDGDSLPWPGRALEQRCAGLLAANQFEWAGAAVYSMFSAGQLWTDCVRWRRGFIDRIRVRPFELYRFISQARRHQPIEEVELTEVPRWSRVERSDDGMDAVFYLNYCHSGRSWSYGDLRLDYDDSGRFDGDCRPPFLDNRVVRRLLAANYGGLRFVLPPPIVETTDVVREAADYQSGLQVPTTTDPLG